VIKVESCQNQANFWTLFCTSKFWFYGIVLGVGQFERRHLNLPIILWQDAKSTGLVGSNLWE